MTAPPSVYSQKSNLSFPSSRSISGRSDWTTGLDAGREKTTLTGMSQGGIQAREDDHDIEFSDTRAFAAEKWRTAVDALDIRPADWSKGRDADSYDTFTSYLRRSIRDCKRPQQKNYLHSLLLVALPMYSLETSFERLLNPETVDMSIIWCLLYLNIAQALQQLEKLKGLTTWLGTLRRSVESLNQSMDNCSDENSKRTQATDIFDPLLGLLNGLLRYQRNYVSEDVFSRELPQIRDFVKQNVDDIDNVVYHFRQIAQNTREQQDLNAHRSAFRLPFRDQHQNPVDRTAFPVDNLPDIRSSTFFGREAVMERIDQYLGNLKTQKLRTYLIYGLRGVGKTQIALEYARRYASKFDAIFWIRCETSASLRQSFTDIAIELALSEPDQASRFEENQMKVLEWLKRTDKHWLLIYDNAEREQALNTYWPRDAVGSVLLTSRSYYNFEHSERREGETVPVFTSDERWELLMELLGSDWQLRHLGGQNGVREREAAHKLLHELGGLALAIAQAANLVRDAEITTDHSIVSVLELFDQTSKSLPPRLFGHRNEKIHALDTIMAIALNRVSKNARSLLGVFALLAPDSIPIDLFLPKDQKRLDGRLEFCKQEPGQTTALEMSPKMSEAIEELKKAQLIRQDGRTFVIHRVIQEAMNFTDMEDLQTLFAATVELLHEAFPLQLRGRPLVDVWPRCSMFVQHVIHITKAFSIHQRSKNGYLASTFNFIQLLSNCGWYLHELADYSECLEMTNVACTAYDDKRSLLYSHLVNTLGATYYEMSQMKKARDNYNKVRELRELHLPADHIQIATILSNLGNVETSEGNLDDAQELFEQAARIKDAHGEEEIVSLGLSFLQLGRVAALREETFVANNRYDKAEACWIRHPKTSEHFIASLYYARGNLDLQRPDLQSATTKYEKCRDICYALFPVHPLAASTFYKLALCDMARGRRYYDKALLNLEKAYNIATVRSGGSIDGAVARIQWKRAEIMIDNPIQRQDGLALRDSLKLDLKQIATDLDLVLNPDWTEDEMFDRLVPGFFR